MKTSYDKPRMTQDGKVLLERSHARRLPGHPQGAETVSDFLARTLDLVKTQELCEWSSIHVYEPLEEWEAVYLTDHNHERMAKLAEWRKQILGYTAISVNFVTLSHAVRFYTKDPAVVAEWRAAMEANPGWPAMLEYDSRTQIALDIRRTSIERQLAHLKEKGNANA